MYISILHYGLGKVFIDKVDDDIDAEEYVSDNYGLDSTYYMTTNEFNLEVNN